MKKILSILSASALALTMSISAFADDKPSKEEIEKAFMEYAVDEAIGDEREWEYLLTDSFNGALNYNNFLNFLDSEEYKNSKYTDIDLSDKKDLKSLENYFYEWVQKNNPIMYPKVKWDITQTKDYDEIKESGIWTAKSTQDYKTTYTAKKSGNKWVMKEDQSGKVVMTIPVIPSKFDYIYENAEKENSKNDDSSRSLVSDINDEEDSVEKASENSTGESSGNNNNSTNEQSDQDNNSSSKNSSAGTNNNTPSGGTSDNGGSSPANGGKSEENSNGNSSNSSASESEENEEQEDSNTTVWVIVLVAVVAAGIIVFFVFKKKK